MNDADWQEQARLSGLVFLRDDDNNINHERPQWKAPEWQEEGRSMMNQHRYGYSYVVVRHAENSQRETIVVLGGSKGDSHDAVNSVLLWNAENGNCCQGPSMIEARSSLTAVVCGDSIYALGGCNFIGKILSSIERITIQDLLYSWTMIDRISTTTTAWQPFHCCLSKGRVDAQSVAVCNRYIVVAGGRSDTVDHQASPTASVDIIDTHLPCLRCAFAGPRLNYP